MFIAESGNVIYMSYTYLVSCLLYGLVPSLLCYLQKVVFMSKISMHLQKSVLSEKICTS